MNKTVGRDLREPALSPGLDVECRHYTGDTAACNTYASDAQEERSTKELLRNWDITIRFMNIGCIVSVGCKTIAFVEIDEAMLAISNYVQDPHKCKIFWEELEYKNNKIN